MSRLSAVSLFAGCGGSDLGLRYAGVEPIWANELSEIACQHYAEVVGPGIIHQGDIRAIEKFPKAEVLVGCYPCQGYSQAGRRTCTDGINFSLQQFDRALRLIKPRAFIVENVDGMRFSQNKSSSKTNSHGFRIAGYRVKWSALDAKDYGLAQDRRRLFLVGIRPSERIEFRFPDPTHGDGHGLKPYRTLRDVIWKYRDAPPDSYDAAPLHWYYLSRNRRRTWGQQAPCVVAHWRHVGLHPDSPPLRRVGTDRWEFTPRGARPTI